MSNEFNPYYEWLGIPPKYQPADHYRLLGIEQFEADPVVVEHAADQRLGFLRTLQTGVRGKIANQLLNGSQSGQDDPPRCRETQDLRCHFEIAKTDQSAAHCPPSQTASYLKAS